MKLHPITPRIEALIKEKGFYLPEEPTLALLHQWIQESYDMYINIDCVGYNNKDKHHSFRCIVKLITPTGLSETVIECTSDIPFDGYIFRSYEAALEAGIIGALNNI
jgi:hypothetical protein